MKRKSSVGRLDGDFSLVRLDRDRRDTAVRLLQGRVILDSDWNEQAEIQSYRRRRGFADLMGPAAAPEGDAGFGVEARSLLRFDGERHFVVIGGAGVEVWGGGAGFTVELFFQPEAGRGGVLLGRFSAADAGSGRGFGHDFTLALTADGAVQLHADGAVFEAPGAVLAARSNHLALTWRRGRARCWLNGREAAFDVDLPLARSPSVVVLGATLRGGSPRQAFAGRLHELRFWAAERDAAQLRSFARPAADLGGDLGDAPPLAGHWRFDRPPDGLEVTDRGPHGVPAVLGGGRRDHAPIVAAGELRITAGRFWLDGMLCLQETPGTLAEPSIDALSSGLWLFYLEAFETLVSATQDSSLLEPALGGLDTSARSRVVARVRAVRFPVADPDVADPDDARPDDADPDDADPTDGDAVLERWRAFEAQYAEVGELRARRQEALVGTEIGNLLYRVEVRSGGAVGGAPWAETEGGARWLELVRGDAECVPARARLRLERRPGPHGPPGEGAPWRVGDALELRGEEGPAGEDIDEIFAAVVAADGAADGGRHEVVIEAAGLERFADLRALRVRRLATFAWSRDNGSVLFAVEGVSDDHLEVQLQTSVRGFELEKGQWVEWLDPRRPGEPGPLHRVVAIDKVLGTVELDPPAPSQPLPGAGGVGGGDRGGTLGPGGSQHVVLRRWDQRELDGAPLVAGAVVLRLDRWQPLENGLEVRWSAAAPYRAGDYWWLPARTALSGIEWPRGEDGEPAARPPDGVARRRALLAAAGRGADGELEVVDYRRTFQPRVDGGVSKDGDTMYGPLRIESSLEASGDVAGRRLLGQLGTDGAVGEANLRPDAVSARVLAPDVGVVPPRASILGDSPDAPAGYRYTGASHRFLHADLVWCRLENLPRTDSRAAATAAGGVIWLVYASGETWIYEPEAHCWRPGPPLPAPRRDFALASLEGIVYLVGGSGRDGAPTLRLDPAVGGWERCAPLAAPRTHLAAAPLEGQLYAVGGLEGSKASSRLEAFDPVLDRWRQARPLPRGRFDLAAAATCGRLYALGGAVKPTFDRFGCRLVGTVEAYHPASDRWLEHLAHLASPRSRLAAAAIGDRLFAVGGGSTAGALDGVDAYDPAADFWRHRHALAGAAPAPAACAHGGWLYVFGVDSQSGGEPGGAWAAKVASELFVHRRLDLDAPSGSTEGVLAGGAAAESGRAGDGPAGDDSPPALPDFEFPAEPR